MITLAPAATLSALHAEGLHKSFRQGEQDVRVLTDVSFSLKRGSMVAVVGPSGSGKSTLLNILGLLTSPDRGRLIIDGHDVSALTPTQQAAFRLGRIAFVFQAFHLIDHKTVAENIELPLIYGSMPRAARQAEVLAVLKKLGLEHRKNSLPATLSGGEKQRVAIGRALVTKPAVLLCDEPTGSLDSARSREVLHLLRELTGPDQATVIVTHDAWVSAQCDDAIRIEDGRVVSSVPVTDPPVSAPRYRRRSSGGARWIALGFREAFSAARQRSRRNAFTMLGVALGVASLVLTVGFSATISAQLSDKFNLYLAQRVTLSSPADGPTSSQTARQWQASEGMARLSTLNGVEAVGVIQDVSAGGATVTLAPDNRTSYEGRIQAPVIATTPEGLDAQGVELAQGRLFDAGHVARGDRVALAGESLMERLGRPWQQGMQFYVNNKPFLIVGVVREDLSAASSVASIYVPLGQGLGGAPSSEGKTTIVLKTAPGAASQVAREAQVAWDPAVPGSMTASAPPEPNSLRQAVDVQQRNLMIGMAAVTLVIGGVGIMNTFMVAVLERRREIGLRMALGSTPGGMMAQFAAEAVLTSAAGAILGVVAAVNILAVTCLINHWTPVISPESIGLGLAAGLLIGLMAGVYPARKASRTDPVDTLSQN
jgi:macrolide transport system ATP-binding/permease protein